MADDIVTRLRRMATDHTRHRTHYDGCAHSHIECAALIAADEIERLRAEIIAVRQQGDRWRAAAEAYERGDMSFGDRLIDEARRG